MQQSNFFPERSQYNFEQNEKALTKSSISHIGDLRSIECHCRMWSRESIAENPRYLTMSDDIDDDIKKYQKTLKIFFQNISWLIQVQSQDVIQWRVIMNRRCQHVLHWSEEMVMVQTMCQDTSSGHLLSFSSTILTLNCSASVRAVCICINCCYLWSNENNEQWDNGCYSVVSPHISMVMVWEVTNNNL